MEILISLMVGIVITIFIRPLQTFALRNKQKKIIIPIALIVGFILVATGYLLTGVIKIRYFSELSRTESLLFLVIWIIPVFLSSIELLHKITSEKNKC